MTQEIVVGSIVKWSGADPDKPEENITYEVVEVVPMEDGSRDYDYVIQAPGHPRNKVRYSEVALAS